MFVGTVIRPKFLNLPLLGILLIYCSKRTTGDLRYVNHSRYNVFDVELLQRAALSTSSNMVISPLSLKICLGMLSEGAVSTTASEIRRALKLPDDQVFARAELKKWMSNLMNYAKAEKSEYNVRIPYHIDSNITIANRIFLDQEFTIKSNYSKTLQEIFSADVSSVNKNDPRKTAAEINNWVKEKTSGLIPSIIQEEDIGKDFAMAQGNAIYFKGAWENPFRKNESYVRCFYKNGEDCIKTELMGKNIKRLKYGFIEDLNAEVVDLPYADHTHSMLIILPEERRGHNQLIQNLNRYPIDKISAKLSQQEVVLLIPKFTVEYDSDMVETFKSMKILRLFEQGAQLHNMINEIVPHLYVSKILHSSKIIVDEEGSEAAGATAGGVVATKVPIQFIADHPFLFFIRNIKSNAILFAGKYIGPSE